MTPQDGFSLVDGFNECREETLKNIKEMGK